MFGWNRTNRSRKQERGFQLDVKLRTEVAQRGARRTWLRALGKVALLGLIVGAVIGGGTLARHHWLHRVEALALRKLPVLTDGVLSEREIVAQAGLRPGLNTFAIDLPTVRARLLRHPRIASAEVHRELPDTIRLHVRERFPVAKVKALSQPGLEFSYLLDESGHVMLPFARGQAPSEAVEAEASLPLLIGLPQAPFVVGERHDGSAGPFGAAFPGFLRRLYHGRPDGHRERRHRAASGDRRADGPRQPRDVRCPRFGQPVLNPTAPLVRGASGFGEPGSDDRDPGSFGDQPCAVALAGCGGRPGRESAPGKTQAETVASPCLILNPLSSGSRSERARSALPSVR